MAFRLPLAPVALLAATLSLSLSPTPALAALEPGEVQRLSNERTLTRWANPNSAAPVRRRPNVRSGRFARLRFYTEYRRPEIYLALARKFDRRGREWVKIRLPRLPNGSTGWVRREELGPYHHVKTRLVINRRRFRASFYRDGKKVWTSRVGVGRPGRATPRGHFWIRERLRSLEGGTIYGPLAFGTSAYSGISDWPRGGAIGVHGTNEPHLIPGRISNGCVRVPNRNIVRLGRIMPLGTPVRIL
jgi:hypothetical protein